MHFEAIDREGKTRMSTDDLPCIPDESQLTSMSTAGYKFKIDGKAVSIKKIKELKVEKKKG